MNIKAYPLWNYLKIVMKELNTEKYRDENINELNERIAEYKRNQVLYS